MLEMKKGRAKRIRDLATLPSVRERGSRSFLRVLDIADFLSLKDGFYPKAVLFSITRQRKMSSGLF